MAQLLKNNAYSALNGAITIGALSLTVATGTGSRFDSPTSGDYFLLTLVDVSGGSESAWEIVKVTARTNDVLTIERAQEGTTARAWASGTPVDVRITAGWCNKNTGDETTATIKTKLGITTLSGSNTGDQTNIAGQSGSTASVAILDTRNTNSLPQDYAASRMCTEFKLNTTNGLSTGGGTYNAVLTLKPWAGFTGGPVTQFGFTSAGIAHIRHEATENVWSGWRQLVDNTNDQAIGGAKTFTGQTGYSGNITEEPVVANTTASYTVTERSMHFLTLSVATTTFTFPALAAGKQFTLLLKQDATGSRAVTWPTTVRWSGGTAPVITATAAKTSVISFLCDGTYWLGFVGGLNYTRA